MKNLLVTKLHFIAIVVPNIYCLASAQNSPTNAFPGSLNSRGIYAGISVIENQEHKLPEIEIRVVNTNEYGFYGEKLPEDPREVGSIIGKIFSDQLLCFRATNLLCGSLDFRDMAGREMLLNHTSAALMAYPSSFSLSAAKKHNPHPPTIFPKPLVHSPELLDRFQLGDYFDVNTPGEYKLTIWPKIYMRSSTNDDICKRIDLPPVTAIIKVDAPQVSP